MVMFFPNTGQLNIAMTHDFLADKNGDEYQIKIVYSHILIMVILCAQRWYHYNVNLFDS